MRAKRRWFLAGAILMVLPLIFTVYARSDGDRDGERTVRRVRIQATNTTVFAPDTFVVAAVGTEGVRGAGTDLTVVKEGDFCDTHYNKVSINEDGNTAVLSGKVVDAAEPANLGAFVKITAHTDGRVNFVFQALTNAGAQTGPDGIDFTGATVSIVNIF